MATSRISPGWPEAAIPVVYLAAALAAGLFNHVAGSAGLIDPLDAIVAALLIRFRQLHWLRVTAMVAAGVLLLHLAQAHSTLGTASAFAAVSAAQILLMAWPFRRPHFRPPAITITQAAAMVLVFGLAVPALASVARAWITAGFTAPGVRAVMHWWIAAALGACLFGPPIILGGRRQLRRLWQPRYRPLNLGLGLMCVLCCAGAIHYVRYPFVVMAVPFMVAAFRTGALGSALISLCCGLEALTLWSLDIRPQAQIVAQIAPLMSNFPLAAMLCALLPPITVGIGSDERRQANHDLRESERRYRDSLQRSAIGTAMIGLDGRWVVTNHALQRLLGYTAEELQSLPPRALSHAEDHAEISRQHTELKEGLVDSYQAERRFLCKDGTWIWLRAAVSLVRGDDGEPLHYIAQLESIEERRQAQAALAVERERLRATLHSIADAVVTTDAAGCITSANPAAEQLLGPRLAGLVQPHLTDAIAFVDEEGAAISRDAMEECIAQGTVTRTRKPFLLGRADNRHCYLEQTVSPVRDSDGNLTGMVVVLHDSTENYEREQQLNLRASRDTLTGLFNRFEFQRRLASAFATARSGSAPAALLAIDLDGFKRVNDTGGHAAGDAVLCHVAATLKSLVRDSDMVARLGGDEFAVLLENCGAERTSALAGRMLAALNPLDTQCNRVCYLSGASIGVAMFEESLESEAAWMSTADAACYHAKREGKAQIQGLHSA